MEKGFRGGQAVKLLFPSLGGIKAALEHCEIHSLTVNSEES